DRRRDRRIHPRLRPGVRLRRCRRDRPAAVAPQASRRAPRRGRDARRGAREGGVDSVRSWASGPTEKIGGDMIRKHTRRAAKAAFAISLGVAIIVGGASAATTGSSRSTATPIIVGTKNFGEAFVLGELYKQALEAKGFDVSYKENIGSTELIQKALTSGKITLYPEYVGIAYTVTFKKKAFPASAQATYGTVKSLYAKKGYTVLRMTPFQDVDAVAVLRTTATKYGLKSVADLKKVPDLTLAAFPEFRTRATGLVGMKKRYGVTDVKFTPLAGISAYKLLDDKK